jgi:septal ring factor EnvC (AmiA/AmiB activator)
MIVADVTPAVAREAQALRAQLEELASLRAVQEAGLSQLSDGLAGVQAARSDLSQAIAERRTLPPPISLDADAMQEVLQSALSLDDFAAFLREQPSTRAGRYPRFRRRAGRAAAPGLGTVLRRFNEADAAGVARPGWFCDLARMRW